MENNIKISIIIPIYNGEEHLEQCLKSVLCQTLKELEIICVDDGSTDRSKEIIEKVFQRMDNRIILLQQSNQGAGMARNKALKKARGKYISFLDADDYYKDKNALELMYETCEERKVAICSSAKKCVYFNDENIIEVFGEEYKDKILYYKDFQMDYYFQNYLFQRKMLIENQIFFPLYWRYQDPPFLVRAMFTYGRFAVADTCLYSHRASDSQKKFNRRKTEDLLKGVFENLLFAYKNHLDILFQNTAERLEKDLCWIIYENISSDNLRILELLLKINRIIGKKYQESNYIVKPLKYIVFDYKRYEKEILHSIKIQKEIAIYGAGTYAKLFLKLLKQNDLLSTIKYIIVSEIDGNMNEIETIPVISLKDFLLNGNNLEVILTVNKHNEEEIMEMLREKHYKNYKILNTIFWELFQFYEYYK